MRACAGALRMSGDFATWSRRTTTGRIAMARPDKAAAVAQVAIWVSVFFTTA